ncbi:MAG: cbb3-type cytochrome oxidase assembly protein [Phycisphaeraceae bacterium]|nr:cbb3-type cytochrome oxidase assembly protein [Phycisphaeraceae bacterium]
MIAKYTDKDAPQPKRDPLTPVPLSRTSRRFLWVFSIVMVAVAGTAFLFKLIEFSISFLSDKSVEAGLIPLVTYLIVAAGFACLFAWATLSGHYRDVEAPKYRMLQMQDEIDAAEHAHT